jgi:HlyD family secretion protein
MLKIDSTVATIGLAGILAIAGGFGLNALGSRAGDSASYISGSAMAQAAAPGHPWAASATGRVEPKDGEVRIASQVAGRIVEVLAKTNDTVRAGDLLLRLDDQDLYVKIAAAIAEVGVRTSEREEEQAVGLALERREGEDAVAEAERTLYAAREAFDAAVRADRGGSGNTEATEAARTARSNAKMRLQRTRDNLAAVNAKPDMPHHQRLEASLSMARAELSTAEIALERTRVRAPADGTVLNLTGKVGETAVPSPDSALVVFGDLSSLRVRAEVEERDAAKVAVGQKVVVKADAFPDKSFEGSVTSISQSLGAPRIATRGPRRPNEVEVIEVMVGLDGNPPLFTGMRVDVFFKSDGNATAAEASAPAAAAKTN